MRATSPANGETIKCKLKSLYCRTMRSATDRARTPRCSPAGGVVFFDSAALNVTSLLLAVRELDPRREDPRCGSRWAPCVIVFYAKSCSGGGLGVRPSAELWGALLEVGQGSEGSWPFGPSAWRASLTRPELAGPGLCGALSLAAALAFGLVPAIESFRLDLIATLRAGGRVDRPLHRRAGAAPVAAEIALGFILVTSAALTGRTPAKWSTWAPVRTRHRSLSNSR